MRPRLCKLAGFELKLQAHILTGHHSMCADNIAMQYTHNSLVHYVTLHYTPNIIVELTYSKHLNYVCSKYHNYVQCNSCILYIYMYIDGL